MKDLFVTTSEDGTIRFWDYKKNIQVEFMKINIDSPSITKNKLVLSPTASDFSKDEEILAVGLNTGTIKFYSTADFKAINEIDARKKPIEVIKYSKDGDLIACASVDNNNSNVIDVYITKTHYKYAELRGAQSKIVQLDWSNDGKFLSCCSHEKELRIFSIINKMMISQYDIVKNEDWVSWTKCFGWPVMGYYDNSNCNIISCERYKGNINDERLIAIGNEKGEIKIYKYPILTSNQKCINGRYSHANKVTRVKFSEADSENNTVLFTSGYDGCLYKWDIESI